MSQMHRYSFIIVCFLFAINEPFKTIFLKANQVEFKCLNLHPYFQEKITVTNCVFLLFIKFKVKLNKATF